MHFIPRWRQFYEIFPLRQIEISRSSSSGSFVAQIICLFGVCRISLSFDANAFYFLFLVDIVVIFVSIDASLLGYQLLQTYSNQFDQHTLPPLYCRCVCTLYVKHRRKLSTVLNYNDYLHKQIWTWLSFMLCIQIQTNPCACIYGGKNLRITLFYSCKFIASEQSVLILLLSLRCCIVLKQSACFQLKHRILNGEWSFDCLVLVDIIHLAVWLLSWLSKPKWCGNQAIQRLNTFIWKVVCVWFDRVCVCVFLFAKTRIVTNLNFLLLLLQILWCCLVIFCCSFE